MKKGHCHFWSCDTLLPEGHLRAVNIKKFQIMSQEDRAIIEVELFSIFTGIPTRDIKLSPWNFRAMKIIAVENAEL